MTITKADVQLGARLLALFAALVAALNLFGLEGEAVEPAASPTPSATMAALEAPDEEARVQAALLQSGYLLDDVPLDYDLQAVLRAECEQWDIPYAIALGLIEVESDFQPDAVSASGCYGLCQLHTAYFPAGLSPAENIRAGMEYLGGQLERYHGDLEAALTAYHDGRDTGERTYARTVLAYAERWAVG